MALKETEMDFGRGEEVSTEGIADKLFPEVDSVKESTETKLSLGQQSMIKDVIPTEDTPVSSVPITDSGCEADPDPKTPAESMIFNDILDMEVDYGFTEALGEFTGLDPDEVYECLLELEAMLPPIDENSGGKMEEQLSANDQPEESRPSIDPMDASGEMRHVESSSDSANIHEVAVKPEEIKPDTTWAEFKSSAKKSEMPVDEEDDDSITILAERIVKTYFPQNATSDNSDDINFLVEYQTSKTPNARLFAIGSQINAPF